MTDFFNLPSKAGQDTQNQYLSQIAQHLGVTAGNLQDAINMANQANQAAAEKITDLETRFQTLTAEQQQDSEVIDARGGKASLGARLDDYDAHLADNVTDDGGVHGLEIESGTWTPTLGADHTYTVQTGYYYKAGSLVFIEGYIEINVADTSGGALAISGLPFARNASQIGHMLGNVSASKISSGAMRIFAELTADSATIVYLRKEQDNGDKTFLNKTDLNNGAVIRLTGSYLL